MNKYILTPIVAIKFINNATPYGFTIAGSPRDLIAKMKVQRSVEVGDQWHSYNYTNVNSELNYSYRVMCDNHYYGSTCSNYCKPRDDEFGHFRCETDGTKVCMDGWQGDYCTEGKFTSTIFCKRVCRLFFVDNIDCTLLALYEQLV